MCPKLQPDYEAQHSWESYAKELMVEYQQCEEEGREIAAYRPLFEAVAAMPHDEHQARMADVLFDVQRTLPQRNGYPYHEPSDLENIRALRPEWNGRKEQLPKNLEDRLLGAWLGRTCGCLLGKPIEGVHTDRLYPMLKASGNWPLHRYIASGDLTQEAMAGGYPLLPDRCWIDTVERAPSDDDTNYTVLAQVLVEKYGRDFTPADVARVWMDYQPKYAYCTAERVAYCNFVKGFLPPASAQWHNPYREWIGAQIRADYFGYVNPGNPELAAEMAWRDASISHVKNGIYGEMYVAAMLAQAVVEDDLEKIIEAGLAQVPRTSRLYEAVSRIVDMYRAGVPQQECQDYIHSQYDEKTSHGWCHTISNAMIVTMALLYGQGDYSRSICMAVQACFDTDCNGATVGSVLGLRGGSAAIGEEWTAPIHGLLDTTIFGVGTVTLKEMARKTMEHIK